MARKKHTFRIILTPQEEGGYLVEVPSLPGCATYGDTEREAIQMAEEAIMSYIGSLILDGEEVPNDEARSVPVVKAPQLQSMISTNDLAFA